MSMPAQKQGKGISTCYGNGTKAGIVVGMPHKHSSLFLMGSTPHHNTAKHLSYVKTWTEPAFM